MKTTETAQNNAKISFVLPVRAQLSGRRRENYFTSTRVKMA